MKFLQWEYKYFIFYTVQEIIMLYKNIGVIAFDMKFITYRFCLFAFNSCQTGVSLDLTMNFEAVTACWVDVGIEYYQGLPVNTYYAKSI